MWFDQMTVVHGTRRALAAVVVVIVAFCLAGLLATAAWPRMHHPARGHRIVPGGQAPLDGFTTPTGAYSFRKLRSAYAGPGVKLQRVDLATQDIGFVGCTGFTGCPLDVAAAAAFCTTACAVNTWYDQSGNGRNLVDAVAANQPLYIASCVGGNPCLSTTAATFSLVSASNFAPATGLASVSVVANRAVGTGACVLLRWNGNNNRIQGNPGANAWLLGPGTFTAVAADAAWHAANGITHPTAGLSVLNIDGVETTGTTVPTTTALPIGVIGVGSGGGTVCNQTEAVFWDNYSLTAGERTVLVANQRSFWGF